MLCKEGSVTDSLAYNISLLAKHSASLEDAGPVPVTCIEFNTLKIVMKQTEKVVFAIISECVWQSETDWGIMFNVLIIQIIYISWILWRRIFDLWSMSKSEYAW